LTTLSPHCSQQDGGLAHGGSTKVHAGDKRSIPHKIFCRTTPHRRQSKAESLEIISVGHRPTKRNTHKYKALQGRNPDYALAGLR